MADYEEQINVDFERGEIVVVKTSRYRLWHDFGGVKRFYVYASLGHVKYIERYPDGSLNLVTADVDHGVTQEALSAEEARMIITDAVNHWVSD